MKHPSAYFSNSKASLKLLIEPQKRSASRRTITFEQPTGIFTPPIAVAGASHQKICCFARENRAESSLFA